MVAAAHSMVAYSTRETEEWTVSVSYRWNAVKKVLKQGFDDDDASLWIKVEKFILLTGPGLKRDVFLFFFLKQ